MKREKPTDHQGFVLAGTLFLLLVLLISAAGGLSLADLEVKTSSHQKSSTSSFYIAEAGVQRAVNRIVVDNEWINNVSDPANVFAGDNTLGDGTYDVAVFADDPNPGDIRITSTGTVNGFYEGNATVEVVVRRGGAPARIFEWASFACGNQHLKGNDRITGGPLYAEGNLHMEASATVSGGNAHSLGNIDLNDSSSIGGSAFANGYIDLDSSASPNVGGNAVAGGAVTGPGNVTGNKSPNMSPDPVQSRCSSSQLADLVITAAEIQAFRDTADITIADNLDQDGGNMTYTGVVHVTGNLTLTGNITLTGDVVFVVDGSVQINAPGSIMSDPPGEAMVTFLVPDGNLHIKHGGTMVIDGTLQVGDENLGGNNIHVQDGSLLEVNGTVAATHGNIDSSLGSLIINYQTPTDSRMYTGLGKYRIISWREVHN